MKINNITIFYICFLASNFIFAQNHKFLAPPSFDEAELKKQHSLIDKSAPAEILYNSIKYNISPEHSVEKEYYSKIKIYDKKKSEEWLNIEIPLQSGELLSKFNVNIYNISNGKVEKITIDKKEQLKENFVKGLKFYKLAIPNILDGSVIEYSYKITTGNIFSITYFLEYSIPVVHQEYNLEYPDSITYIFNSAGTLLRPRHHVSITQDRKGVLYNVFRFGYENIKPIKKELFVNDLNRFRARIKPELTRYTNKYYSYTTPENWNKAAERLNDNENFGVFLESNVKGILPDEIKNYYDVNERADKIFNFVKNNYKWNRNFSIITSQSLKQLTKTKSGNSADINLLLVLLFRNSGIEADPLLISTIDNGILNVIIPNINNLNMVLASAKIKEQTYFYDATSYNSKVNILPKRDWNDFGILFQKNKATELSFSNTNISKKTLTVKASLDLENSNVKGFFSQKETGLYAIDSYDEFDFNKDKYNQTFKTKYAAEIETVESKLEDNGDFESRMSFSSQSLMDIVGSKIIINPLLFLTAENEYFTETEERKYQIDFISAFTREKIVELEIPEAYKIADMPKAKIISTNDKEITYSYKSEIIGNKIRISSKISVANENYPKEYYPAFKQIWKVISDSENQVMSLIKK